MSEPDKVARVSRLLDLYGSLLTDRQRTLCRQYYDEDLSLAELAEESGVSRQSVHDAIKTAEAALESFERELRLLEGDHRGVAASLRELASQLRTGSGPDPRTLADRLEDLARRLGWE